MENNIVSLGVKVKGEIVIEKVVDNVIIDTIKVNNTWLDIGTQLIIQEMAQSGSDWSTYVNVSSYSGAVNYTDTVIPNVLFSIVGTRTYETTQKRHKFVGIITAPVGAPRTINAVGLSYLSGGVSPYCYTVLSTPVVQQVTETLYVYYYVYIQQPLVDGFGYNGYNSFASKWFDCATSVTAYWMQYLSGNIKIDESNPTNAGYSLGNKVVRQGYYSMGWTGNVGDSGNLTTDTGFISGVGFLNSSWAYTKFYDGSMIGRVWAKAKTSSAQFFDSSNLPLGWGKAINIRAEVEPYNTDVLEANIRIYITTSGAVGVGKYYLFAYEPGLPFITGFYVITYALLKAPLEIITKFGRNWIVAAMFSAETYTQWMSLCNVDTGGYINGPSRNSTSNTCFTFYPIYENFVGFENIIFLMSRKDQKLCKYSASDGNDLSTLVLEKTYDMPSVPLHGVGLSVDSLIYFYSISDNVIFTFNPVTEIFTSTQLNVGNYWMGAPTQQSWGGYDSDKDWIMLENDKSLMLFDRLSINNVSSFSGVANFSGITIKDWSKIQVGDTNGVLSLSAGKLLLTTSKGYLYEGSTFETALQIGQLITAGTFEVTCCIESFDPTVNYQEIGLLVSIPGWTGFHKRIGKQYNSVKQLAVKDNVNGALVTVEATVAFTGVYVRFKITRDSSNIIRCYYSTDPISTPDPSATWTLLGNATYALSGKVIVGLYGLTRAGATVGVGTISDFRVNSGIVDKTVNTIYLNNHYVVNDISRTSRYGTVLKKDGYYHCLGTTHIIMVDAVTLNLYSEVAHGGASVTQGYMYDSDFYPIAMLYSAGPSFVNNLYYDSILHTWIVNLLSRSNWGMIPYKQGFVMGAGSDLLYYVGLVWDWNGSNWVLTSSASPVGKLTHADWKNIPLGLQLRCCNKVSNPSLTFNSADQYSCTFCKNGIIKDNVQYVTNIGFQQYFGNAQFAEESYTGVASNFTLQAKINNAATWLTADLGMAWEFKFKDSVSGAYSYWNSILTSNNVDSVTSKSTFTSNDPDINWAYNYYKGSWVKFTTGNNNGIARQITEYDGYNRKFVTVAFPGDIVIGDLFDIVNPADATRILGNGDDSIPIMTSDTAPSGICSASYDNANAYKAFDANTGTVVQCPVASLPYTITYEFPVSKIIRCYSVVNFTTTNNSPKDWTFQAWDGSNWIVLNTQSNISWSTNERKVFLLINTTSYIKYRIVVTALVSGGTICCIAELEMYEIPSNYFYINESLGQVYVSTSDVGKNTDLKYVWVGRSW